MDGEQQMCKSIPVQAWTGRKCNRRLNLSGLLDNRHMKVARLSDLRPGRHYPLVLISVGGRKQLGSLYIYFTIYFRQHNIKVLSLPRHVST